jgi:ketosteroid isomerase-like protein
MSENLDFVRSIYAAWELGDFRSADWAAPDIEFVIAHGLSPGDTIGVPAMRERFNGWLSLWKDYRIEGADYREIDAWRVLVVFRFHGIGKTSGINIAQIPANGAHLFHMRGGRVTKLINYADADRALADLGLKDG